MAYSGIPLVMRDELLCAMQFIKALANRRGQLNPVIVELFGDKLTQILCRKYAGRWYMDNPNRGQEYRCIRCTPHDMDPSILEACARTGLNYTDLALPEYMTMWINPYDVSCCVGKKDYSSAMHIFCSMRAQLLNLSLTVLRESGIASSSPPPSPSSESESEDSDSGIEDDYENINTTPTSCSPPLGEYWWPIVCGICSSGTSCLQNTNSYLDPLCRVAVANSCPSVGYCPSD